MNKRLNLKNGLRMTAVILAISVPLGMKAEPGQSLAQLLVEKGVITQAEAASLDSIIPAGLVDLLVAKGVISADDAASLESPAAVASSIQPTPTATAPASTPAVAVKAKDKAVETLTINGRIQGQWDLLSTSYDNVGNPRGENNLFMRRLHFGATAQFADGITGTFNTNFANDVEGTGETEKAIIEIDITDHHTLTAGYQKVPFGFEETTSSAKIFAVERSIATRYFSAQLDLGSRHTGVYLSGEYDSGAYFTVAVTNPEAHTIASSSGNDRLAIWAQTGWFGEVGEGSLDIGIGGGHIPGSRTLKEDDTVWNFYTNYIVGPFGLMAEVLGGTIEAARANGSDAKPLAFTILPSWKINKHWDLVGRYTSLDADKGIGADISTTFRRSAEAGSALFDSVEAYYIGGNWYIRGNSIKLSAGYEWAKFEDNLTGSQGNADVDGFRTRLQLLF